MPQLLLILLTCTSFCLQAQNSCEQLRDSLENALKFPQIFEENSFELDVWLHFDFKSDSPTSRYLTEEYSSSRAVQFILADQALESIDLSTLDTCECLFQISYRITYLDKKFTQRFDAEIPPQAIIDSLKSAIPFHQILVEASPELTKWLAQEKERYVKNRTTFTFADTVTDLTLIPKRLLKAKDSIFIRIEENPQLFAGINIWEQRLKPGRTKWRSIGTMGGLPPDEVFRILAALPNRPKGYPDGILDGVTYRVYIKHGNTFRMLYISNPEANYDSNGLWPDAEFLKILN